MTKFAEPNREALVDLADDVNSQVIFHRSRPASPTSSSSRRQAFQIERMAHDK
jgi:hypothetical protein